MKHCDSAQFRKRISKQENVVKGNKSALEANLSGIMESLR